MLGQSRLETRIVATSGPAPSHRTRSAPVERSPGSFSATRPHRPKNRLAVVASASAGGRGAGPEPPASPPAGGRGGSPDPAAARGSRPAPSGNRRPTPTQPRRSCSARPPALHGEQEEGQGDGSRNGGSGGRHKLRLAAPSLRARVAAPGAAEQRLTQEAAPPAAASLQLCGGLRPAGNSPGRRAGKGAGGPGGDGGGAYLSWCRGRPPQPQVGDSGNLGAENKRSQRGGAAGAKRPPAALL